VLRKYKRFPSSREHGLAIWLFLIMLVLVTLLVGGGLFLLLDTISDDYVDDVTRPTQVTTDNSGNSNQQPGSTGVNSASDSGVDTSGGSSIAGISDAELYPDTDPAELAQLAADADRQERMFDESQPADIILDAEPAQNEAFDQSVYGEDAQNQDSFAQDEQAQSSADEQLSGEQDTVADADPEDEQADDLAEQAADADATGDLLISGKVVNQSGLGVAGMTVRLQRVGGSSGRGATATISGSDGKFRFENLVAGDFTLSTENTSEYSQTSVVVKAGVSSAELKVAGRTRITISGEITGADGAPLANARISNPDGGGIISNSSGKYRLSMVVEPNRSYGLKFNATGYREEIRHVHASTVDENSNINVDVRMVSAGGVSANGAIISSTGQPVGGATVWLTSPSLNVRGQAMSDAKGEFSVAGLKAAADYRLIINASGYSRYQQNNLALDAGSLPLAIEMSILPAGNITGLITDEDRNPVANFTMLVVSVDSFGQSLAVSSDDNGYFQADGIPSGEIRFQTRSVPSMSVTGVQLPEGQRVEADLIVDWGNYSISGYVSDDKEKRIADAKLILRWTATNNGLVSDSTRRSQTDPNGEFSFSELGPGRHELVIESDGRFQQKSVLIDVRTQAEPLSVVVNASP